jgi:hypothetical protein
MLRKATWLARLSHTKERIIGRAGMPEPGRLGPRVLLPALLLLKRPPKNPGMANPGMAMLAASRSCGAVESKVALAEAPVSANPSNDDSWLMRARSALCIALFSSAVFSVAVCTTTRTSGWGAQVSALLGDSAGSQLEFASSAGTEPNLPVFHGIGSTCGCASWAARSMPGASSVTPCWPIGRASEARLTVSGEVLGWEVVGWGVLGCGCIR